MSTGTDCVSSWLSSYSTVREAYRSAHQFTRGFSVCPWWVGRGRFIYRLDYVILSTINTTVLLLLLFLTTAHTQQHRVAITCVHYRWRVHLNKRSPPKRAERKHTRFLGIIYRFSARIGSLSFRFRYQNKNPAFDYYVRYTRYYTYSSKAAKSPPSYE